MQGVSAVNGGSEETKSRTLGALLPRSQASMKTLRVFAALVLAGLPLYVQGQSSSSHTETRPPVAIRDASSDDLDEAQKALLSQFVRNNSERWVVIELEDTMLAAFDKQTVQEIAPRTYRVWFRVELPQWTERWSDTASDGSKVLHDELANANLMQEDFDCTKHRTRDIKMSVYRDRHVVWGPVELKPPYDAWTDVVPDLSAEHWEREVCRIAPALLKPEQ